MGGRVRPIGGAGIPSWEHKRVRCWNCQKSFEVARTMARAPCPECGSQVAVHRLRMPMMPTGGGPKTAGEEVIRLQEVEEKAHEWIRNPSALRVERMPVGPDGERSAFCEEGRGEEGTGSVTAGHGTGPVPHDNGPVPGAMFSRGEEETGPATPVRRPFEPRRRIEPIRETRFTEADPRWRAPGDPAIGAQMRWALVVAATILLALIILAVAIAGWNV